VRVLTDVQPTPEQLPLLNYRPGFVLIRGAAGSGKTTTAVLRLQAVTGVWRRERAREENATPIRVLVLTFNRTLRGYIAQLVQNKLSAEELDLTLNTFGGWGKDTLDRPDIMNERKRERWLWENGSSLGFEKQFLLDEVAYVLGRFAPEQLADYTDSKAPTFERRGRGATPRVSRAMRKRILSEVVHPFLEWKGEEGFLDWSDIAIQMSKREVTDPYDIVLVDEAQDFSANQVRGVVRHLAKVHSTAFVLDAVQQIYPHGFTWTEAGVDIAPDNSFRLGDNHRNTKQIAAFAAPLIRGLPLDDDGTLPDLASCKREGEIPTVVRGLFRDQMTWIVERMGAIPKDESAVLLHAKGGGYFDYAKARLREAGIPFVEMTRRSEWPQGDEQVGLSTLHSAKGLEFDHVIIMGLNGGELMPHGDEADDGQLANHRRLVAMGIARGRKSASITFKPEEASKVIEFLDSGTYETVDA
jgi:superfamily I DNA/RNA helicase